MAQTRYSLRGRLLVSATLVLLVFLGLMGLVLDQAFQRSAEEGVSERLLLHTWGLLAVTEEGEEGLYWPEHLQEPDFNRLGSGLYALVMTAGGNELWRSPSALTLDLDPGAKVRLYSNLAQGERRFGIVEDVGGEPMFYSSYRVLWQGAEGSGRHYVFTVLQTMEPFLSEVRGFRNNLWGWLAGVVVALLIVQAIVMSWGLSPLNKLAADLKAIEDGDRDYLEGDYPAEIEGVTRNLNLLLASERGQREKYRTTLADLAHSLKTPLAILRGASSSLEYMREGGDADLENIQATVDEQVERMDQIVAWQLERALVSSVNLIRKPVDVKRVAEKLIDAMNKVYEGKELTISLSAEDCSFFGDERDLMELLGNLVDNACKYGKRQVHVTIGTSASGELAPHAREKDNLIVLVEDDGAGIAADDREAVLRRGIRADSRAQGHGIGLSVVGEIVERYDGRITIDESELGGARLIVTLPWAGGFPVIDR